MSDNKHEPEETVSVDELQREHDNTKREEGLLWKACCILDNLTGELESIHEQLTQLGGGLEEAAEKAGRRMERMETVLKRARQDASARKTVVRPPRSPRRPGDVDIFFSDEEEEAPLPTLKKTKTKTKKTKKKLQGE
jgi:hypothetical protein